MKYVMIMAASIMAVLLTLAGCGDDAPGKVFTSPSFAGRVDWPSICEDGTSTVPLCGETLKITPCYYVGDTDGNGLEESFCAPPVAFTRPVGGTEATATFAPPPVEAGQKVVAYLTYEGITLGESDKMETCDSKPLPASIDLLPDVPKSLCLRLLHNSGTGGSGEGNVKLVAIDNEGAAVTGCGWNFNSDQLDDDCAVNADGATCNAIAIGNYTVDVSCQDGALVKTGYAFEVVEDKTTDYTVIVNPPGSTGSGLGDLCVSLVDENGDPIDESTCTFTVDGVLVTPDADVGNLCDGALLKGLDAKVSEIEAVCGNATGSLSTEVAEDTQSNVTIEVSDEVVAPTTGSVCVSVLDNVGQPKGGCALAVVQLPGATPEPPPNGVTCTGTGKSYFELPPGTFTLAATCADASGSAPVIIVAGVHVAQDVYTYGAVPDGDLCSVDHAFIVDVYAPTLNLEAQLGYGVNGGCNPAAVTDWTDISVVSLSGPNCQNLSDPNCRVTVMGGPNDPLVNGVHQHLLWTADLTGMGAKELLIFSMGFEDAGTQQSLTRNLWVYNGDAVDL